MNLFAVINTDVITIH